MREYTLLRVFTRGPHGGNRLGVVTDLDGLDDTDMAAIARHLGYSETIFLQLGEPEVHARIFTPAAEIPFAGHPLVGAGWLLSIRGHAVDRIVCGIGAIGIRRRGEEVWIEVPPDRPVEPAEVEVTSWVPAVAQATVLMPIPYLVVEAPAPAVVAAAPSPPSEIDDVYLWAWKDSGESVKARFFAAGLGVPEDPATGSAAVALAAVLSDRGMSEGRLEIHQGDEIGAPSTLHLEWTPGTVAVGGTVADDGSRPLVW